MPPVWKDGAPLWVDGAPAFATDPCDCCGDGVCQCLGLGGVPSDVISYYVSVSGVPGTATLRFESFATGSAPRCHAGSGIGDVDDGDFDADGFRPKLIKEAWSGLSIYNGTRTFTVNASCQASGGFLLGQIGWRIDLEWWPNPATKAPYYAEYEYDLYAVPTGFVSANRTLIGSTDGLEYSDPPDFIFDFFGIYTTGWMDAGFELAGEESPPAATTDTTGSLNGFDCSIANTEVQAKWDWTREQTGNPSFPTPPACTLSETTGSESYTITRAFNV